MTARECFEGLLTELSKVHAPSMLLSDFNYFFNKTLYQFINKRYNYYDTNQESSDGLRVLKSTAILDAERVKTYGNLTDLDKYSAGDAKMFGATYETYLPLDYVHLLNCICIYKVKSRFKCWNEGDYVKFPAKRLTADAWSIVSVDYYNRPQPWRPYYYIHNVNTQTTLPTNPLKDSSGNEIKGGTDYYTNFDDPTDIKFNEIIDDGIIHSIVSPVFQEVVYVKSFNTFVGRSVQDKTMLSNDWPTKDSFIDPSTNEPYKDKLFNLNGVYYKWNGTLVKTVKSDKNQMRRTIKLGNPDNRTVSTVDKETGLRYSNPTNIRMEIRYGDDDSIFELEKVVIDYLKAPQTIRLTQEQVNLTKDTSQIMEFPDYVCQEIINELVTLVMENTADPRLQTHPVVTQSIATPAQQQAAQPTVQAAAT